MLTTSICTFDHQQLARVLSEDMHSRLFPPYLEVVPQLNEVYELQLAFYESQVLSQEEMIRNGAYFARVGEAYTRHFLMCSGEPVRLPQFSSSRLRSFFQSNQFKTGYATHGLFPYRGKFHPQMIKGLLNVMGLKPGSTVLDPMMGSGTVLIEASLMGITSIGVDSSPFCRFMTQAKLDALTVPLAPIRAALQNPDPVFAYFNGLVDEARQVARRAQEHDLGGLFAVLDAPGSYWTSVSANRRLPAGSDRLDVYNVLLLAFLDAAGYSERSNRRMPGEQFRGILERYLFVAEKIQGILAGVEYELAQARPLEGDARNLPLEDESVDGIIFSPPYSFAIDYLANDAFHLAYMGVDVGRLRERMIGLRGGTIRQQYDFYRADMGCVLGQCARVLRPGGLCTIVVGTNNNQLSKILGVAPEDVQGIDEMLADLGAGEGLGLIRKLQRQITGMANTIRTEYIVFLQRI